jgi:hypothetical protein
MQTFLRNVETAYGVINPQEDGQAAAAPAVGRVGDFQQLDLTAGQVTAMLARLKRDPEAHGAPLVVPPPAAAAHGGDANAAAGPAAAKLVEMQVREGDKPSAGQLVVLHEVAAYFDAVHAGRDVLPPRWFLTGPGGSGKSFLFKCIEELSDSIGRTIAPTALTGIAASNIPTRTFARTVYSLFQMGITHESMAADLSAEKFAVMCNAVGQPVLIIVDEISFAHAEVIACLDMRLRKIMNSNVEFGGVAVLFSGDFYQLPPVKSPSLYSLAMRRPTRQQDASLRGTDLFLTCQRRSLTEQMRCLDDVHYGFCDRLRHGITTGLKDYLLEHVLRASDAEEFKNAPLISPGKTPRARKHADPAHGHR